MRFRFHFKGRKLGAIGIFHEITAEAEGDDLDAAKLALYERYEHISFGGHVRLMWAPTYVDKDGNNTLMVANQGRNFFESREACQKWIDAVIANNQERTIESVWGKNAAGTFAPRKVQCYDHGDAIKIYF